MSDRKYIDNLEPIYDMGFPRKMKRFDIDALAKQDWQERRVYWVWVNGIEQAVSVRIVVDKQTLYDMGAKAEVHISGMAQDIAIGWLHTEAKVLRPLHVERVQRMPDEKGGE